jgi:2-C-methyl-D-erythritol 4-phosphate cytidylyltransferase
MMKVSVIIPAAGASTRFGGRGKKIFERIKDRPIFVRSIELFVNRDDVCQVQLVIAPDDAEAMQTTYAGNLGFMGVKLIVGGANRTESVRNALAKVADEADFVCVHDAVRPCVSPVWIDEVFAAAEKHGAAILAYPVHGTLKRVDEQERIVETVDRAGLWEAQTPQVFRKDLLIKAYEGPTGATDDAALVEATGATVAVVRGDPRNVKITTKADLALAAAVIDSLPKPKPKRNAGPFDEAQW